MTAATSLPSRLSAEHVALLRARGIPLELALAAGLQSADGTLVAKVLGRDKPCWSGGLAIPYPGSHVPPYWRVRLDSGKVRYLCPKDRPIPAYSPPHYGPAGPADLADVLLVVEAPLKALAMVATGLSAVGLGGVATTLQDGALDPSWGDVRGRDVRVLFDANRASNPDVQMAERRLVLALERAGARVTVCSLPLHEGADQGPDDFYARHGAEALYQIVREAKPMMREPPPLEPKREELVDEFSDDDAPWPADNPDTQGAVATERSYMCTDSGNAERFAAMHGDRVRYCPAWGKWLLWDGRRWAVDARGAVRGLAKKTVRAIYGEAAHCNDDALREKIAKWAAKSEARDKRAAMLDLAQCEPGIAVVPADLDRDPWLLNTPSGTVDLHTGVERPHDRADLITRCTSARFDGGARSDLWERVLSDAMGGDAELVAFFQRAAGYSITGLTTEEKLFMPIGPAATGKSTLIQAIIAALGDYAKTADFEAFIAQKNGGGPRNDIARLAGARFVASIEVDKGKRLAQGLVKSLTGGDVVSARFLYQEAFEFVPTFTLWLVANDAPHVADDDPGMWRRILRIPFVHVVPPEKRDPAVKSELVDPERAGPAILAWLVAGCVQWQAKGLRPPASVTAATDAYREGEDPIAPFLADCCMVSSGITCSRSALRDAYERWVDEAGGRAPLTGQEFTTRIRSVSGVSEKTVRGVRWWTGIGLLSHERDPEGDLEGADDDRP